MAPEGIKNCSTGVKSKHALKKGPWTANEDMMLVEYVKNHGEGNWNAVQRNSGLLRCGKSCRLRWANHLRPNLKKGAFSGDEEKLIVELHAKLGNKWARMAAQLPGRTDNEIKNYWNTRLKRRQRAGLPVYPQELHQEQHHQLHSSSQQTSLSSLLLASSSHHPNPNPLHFFNSFNSPLTINRPLVQPNLKLFHDNSSSSLTLSLAAAATNPSFSSSTLRAGPFFNQGLSNPLPMPSVLQYNFLNFGSPGLRVSSSGLPSIQSAVTPAASSSDQFMIETSSDDAEDFADDPGYSRRKNSGLLEDLLGESQALTGPEKTENSCIAPPENEHEKEAFTFGHGDENNPEGQNDKRFTEGDDDLLNLLDNFPMAVPIPDWDERNGGDGSPNLTNGENGTIESQHEGSGYNPVANSSKAENQEWSIGYSLWNNMPSIY